MASNMRRFFHCNWTQPIRLIMSRADRKILLCSASDICRLGLPYLDGPNLITNRRFAKRSIGCPYIALGVQKGVEYKIVKKAFLKLAMKHHPDTAGHDTEDLKKKAVEIFMKVRTAFEAIVELPDGSSGLKSEHVKDGHGVGHDEFDTWFKTETGLNPFDLNLDAETLKEVADASASQAGLDR